MRFLGGKSKTLKYKYILQEAIAETGIFYEPFVGGFNVVPQLLTRTVYCSDNDLGLITFYLALQDNWFPREN